MPILVDCNQVFISFIMAQLASDRTLQPDVNLCRHMILSSTLHYKQKFSKEFGEIVFCDDSSTYWRKTLFPYYKSHRKKNRDNSKYDWDMIFKFLATVKEELQNHFPYKFIRVKDAEADDVIACIAKYESRHLNSSTLILSNDMDFIQLQKYSGVTQYSLKQKRYLNYKDPKTYLFEKVLRGDSGDGIPNFLSDDDALSNPDKCQKSIYAKKMTVWLENRDIDMITENDKQLKKNIVRNTKLIDFSCIPQEIETQILEEYKKETPVKRDFVKYFMKNNLRLLVKEANKF